MFKKIKSKIKMPKEEKMLWLLLALPIAFLPLIYRLTPDSFYIGTVFQWSKVIDYYIELLSAVGAVFLGVIAISQTQRLQNLEERADYRANSCNIMMNSNHDKNKWVLSNEMKYDTSKKYIDVCFQNYSDAFLKSVDIDFGEYHFRSHITLANGESKVFKIYLPKDDNAYKNRVCTIMFTSCYNEKTYADFEVTEDNSKNKKQNDNRKIIKHYHFYGTEQPK